MRTLVLSLLLGSVLALAACRRDEATPPIDTARVSAETVTVYFPDRDLQHLEPEVRDAPAVAGQPDVLARAVVEELLKGPVETPDHVRVIPETVTVHAVTLEGGTAVVDLSRSFADDFHGGSGVAALAVYSLVNSLTGVPGVEKVQILLDGQPGGDFAGVLSLAEPLTADPSLVGGEPLRDDRP